MKFKQSLIIFESFLVCTPSFYLVYYTGNYFKGRLHCFLMQVLKNKCYLLNP